MPNQLTPMMQHYMELKDKYPDCLLFYRLGDFYEMFFEDAEKASKELELVLTGRDCGLEQRAPMCGVPHHSVESYIAKLVNKGYKVAICEQLEDPALAKGLVDRDVIRVITPGTVIEEKMLEGNENNYICSVSYEEKRIGLAYAEISTGSFMTMELTGEKAPASLIDELERIHPREIIANESLFLHAYLYKRISAQYYLSSYASQAYLFDRAERRLKNHFGILSLEGFGLSDHEAAVSASGALMQYLEETQKNTLSHIHTIRYVSRSEYMQLDVSTRRNLELTHPLRPGGSKKNTLVSLIDKTRTAMGARKLREWIESPLTSGKAIEERLDAVEDLKRDVLLRKGLQGVLDRVYDIERLCSRIVYGTVNARDCLSLKQTLVCIPEIRDCFDQSDQMSVRLPLSSILEGLDDMPEVHALIEKAIDPNAPAAMKDGGYIRSGFDREIDELRNISVSAKKWLGELESKEKEKSGIPKLRIGYNRVFGYYFEVTKSGLEQVPDYFIRKQTLVNCERFITPELKDLEEKILGAEEKLTTLESQAFDGIRKTLLEVTGTLQSNASLIAMLDVFQAFAEIAASGQYCRPSINERGEIRIVNGRHPIIEKAQQDRFVPNDTCLDMNENRLLIITGPNMAGKSTYMRQTALIVLMTHIGCFVPADEASVCLVDRIFTRIGASDDISAGQSTFMVEMNEMANILRNATSKSLLIIDEIGRGTSTFDGLSIAWAVLEYIADRNRCGAKTLFATHYHELTELEGKLNGIKNYRISVREVGDDIVFLRRIVRGSGDKSFGVQVAKLAGIPDPVISRAKEILGELESADIAKGTVRTQVSEQSIQLSLLDPTPKDAVMRELRELDPDKLTPIDALNKLYQLHAMIL